MNKKQFEKELIAEIAERYGHNTLQYANSWADAIRYALGKQELYIVNRLTEKIINCVDKY